MNWRVNSILSSRLRTFCCLLLAGGILGGFTAEAKSKKKNPSPPPAESPTPAPEETKKGIDIPIPINHSAQGVCVPIWTDGKLQMRYNMEVAFRVDSDQLRLSQLKLETFNDGEPEMVIDMPQSMLNLQTRILTSTDPVTIRRKDLLLVGQNMTFDTQTRQGKFVGPVRVLIYQQDQEDAPKKEAQPAASPNPSPVSE
ncbi:MAG: hypothetical protein ACFUZC_17500 [Chthoniobacteraceae bacterium]